MTEYRWWTIMGGRQVPSPILPRERAPWLKLGPLTIVLVQWRRREWHFEAHWLNHLLFRVPELR